MDRSGRPEQLNLRAALLGLFLGAALPACSPDSTGTQRTDMVPVADLSESREERVQKGLQDVQTRGCPMCHQATDGTDGVLSGNSTPVPGTLIYAPNLTPDPDTGLSFWTDAQIIRAIREDIDNVGRPLCWVMPHWQMSDREVTEIVAYLRSLKPVMHNIPLGPCPPKG